LLVCPSSWCGGTLSTLLADADSVGLSDPHADGGFIGLQGKRLA